MLQIRTRIGETHRTRWGATRCSGLAVGAGQAVALVGRVDAPPGIVRWDLRSNTFEALRDGETYAQKWQYVRENPVRAGLVGRPEDWPYFGRVHEIRF